MELVVLICSIQYVNITLAVFTFKQLTFSMSLKISVGNKDIGWICENIICS